MPQADTVLAIFTSDISVEASHSESAIRLDNIRFHKLGWAMPLFVTWLILEGCMQLGINVTENVDSDED